MKFNVSKKRAKRRASASSTEFNAKGGRLTKKRQKGGKRDTRGGGEKGPPLTTTRWSRSWPFYCHARNSRRIAINTNETLKARLPTEGCYPKSPFNMKGERQPTNGI